MLIGHVPNGGLGNPVEGLCVDPQTDGIDRSGSLIGFEQEGEEQFLPRSVGEVSGVRLGGQPDGVDQRIEPTQPIKVPLLEGDQGGSAYHDERRVSIPRPA
jgi:hypothetical protein